MMRGRAGLRLGVDQKFGVTETYLEPGITSYIPPYHLPGTCLYLVYSYVCTCVRVRGKLGSVLGDIRAYPWVVPRAER